MSETCRNMSASEAVLQSQAKVITGSVLVKALTIYKNEVSIHNQRYRHQIDTEIAKLQDSLVGECIANSFDNGAEDTLTDETDFGIRAHENCMHQYGHVSGKKFSTIHDHSVGVYSPDVNDTSHPCVPFRNVEHFQDSALDGVETFGKHFPSKNICCVNHAIQDSKDKDKKKTCMDKYETMMETGIQANYSILRRHRSLDLGLPQIYDVDSLSSIPEHKPLEILEPRRSPEASLWRRQSSGRLMNSCTDTLSQNYDTKTDQGCRGSLPIIDARLTEFRERLHQSLSEELNLRAGSVSTLSETATTTQQKLTCNPLLESAHNENVCETPSASSSPSSPSLPSSVTETQFSCKGCATQDLAFTNIPEGLYKDSLSDSACDNTLDDDTNYGVVGKANDDTTNKKADNEDKSKYDAKKADNEVTSKYDVVEKADNKDRTNFDFVKKADNEDKSQNDVVKKADNEDKSKCDVNKADTKDKSEYDAVKKADNEDKSKCYVNKADTKDKSKHDAVKKADNEEVNTSMFDAFIIENSDKSDESKCEAVKGADKDENKTYNYDVRRGDIEKATLRKDHAEKLTSSATASDVKLSQNSRKNSGTDVCIARCGSTFTKTCGANISANLCRFQVLSCQSDNNMKGKSQLSAKVPKSGSEELLDTRNLSVVKLNYNEMVSSCRMDWKLKNKHPTMLRQNSEGKFLGQKKRPFFRQFSEEVIGSLDTVMRNAQEILAESCKPQQSKVSEVPQSTRAHGESQVKRGSITYENFGGVMKPRYSDFQNIRRTCVGGSSTEYHNKDDRALPLQRHFHTCETQHSLSHANRCNIQRKEEQNDDPNFDIKSKHADCLSKTNVPAPRIVVTNQIQEPSISENLSPKCAARMPDKTPIPANRRRNTVPSTDLGGNMSCEYGLTGTENEHGDNIDIPVKHRPRVASPTTHRLDKNKKKMYRSLSVGDALLLWGLAARTVKDDNKHGRPRLLSETSAMQNKDCMHNRAKNNSKVSLKKANESNDTASVDVQIFKIWGIETKLKRWRERAQCRIVSGKDKGRTSETSVDAGRDRDGLKVTADVIDMLQDIQPQLKQEDESRNIKTQSGSEKSTTQECKLQNKTNLGFYTCSKILLFMKKWGARGRKEIGRDCHQNENVNDRDGGELKNQLEVRPKCKKNELLYANIKESLHTIILKKYLDSIRRSPAENVCDGLDLAERKKLGKSISEDVTAVFGNVDIHLGADGHPSLWKDAEETLVDKADTREHQETEDVATNYNVQDNGGFSRQIRAMAYKKRTFKVSLNDKRKSRDYIFGHAFPYSLSALNVDSAHSDGQERDSHRPEEKRQVKSDSQRVLEACQELPALQDVVNVKEELFSNAHQNSTNAPELDARSARRHTIESGATHFKSSSVSSTESTFSDEVFSSTVSFTTPFCGTNLALFNRFGTLFDIGEKTNDESGERISCASKQIMGEQYNMLEDVFQSSSEGYTDVTELCPQTDVDAAMSTTATHAPKVSGLCKTTSFQKVGNEETRHPCNEDSNSSRRKSPRIPDDTSTCNLNLERNKSMGQVRKDVQDSGHGSNDKEEFFIPEVSQAVTSLLTGLNTGTETASSMGSVSSRCLSYTTIFDILETSDVGKDEKDTHRFHPSQHQEHDDESKTCAVDSRLEKCHTNCGNMASCAGARPKTKNNLLHFLSKGKDDAALQQTSSDPPRGSLQSLQGTLGVSSHVNNQAFQDRDCRQNDHIFESPFEADGDDSSRAEHFNQDGFRGPGTISFTCNRSKNRTKDSSTMALSQMNSPLPGKCCMTDAGDYNGNPKRRSVKKLTVILQNPRESSSPLTESHKQDDHPTASCPKPLPLLRSRSQKSRIRELPADNNSSARSTLTKAIPFWKWRIDKVRKVSAAAKDVPSNTSPSRHSAANLLFCCMTCTEEGASGDNSEGEAIRLTTGL